ncbi:MAG: hypothetical protein ACRD8U_10890 [Pyrinomonadaceae bacterium]
MKKKVTDLSTKLDAIVKTIQPPPVRGVMSHVFATLTDLLESVELLEICVHSDETLVKVNHVFRFTNRNAQALISYIETTGKKAPGMSEELSDLLDGTNFAIDHELQRTVVISESGSDTSSQELRSKYMRSYGLLRNCFQQCILTLASGVRPSVDGRELFDDFTLLHEQSVVLLEALTVLSQQADRAEKARDVDSYFSLTEGIKIFKQGYMHFLIYRDWAEFDTYSEKLLDVRTEAELWPLAEQFARYLETLMGHVQMREVLQNRMLQESLVEQ